MAGASKAHRWTKLPVAWRPPRSKEEPNDHEAEPAQVLAQLANKFLPLWRPLRSPLPDPDIIVFPHLLPDVEVTTKRQDDDEVGWTKVEARRRRRRAKAEGTSTPSGTSGPLESADHLYWGGDRCKVLPACCYSKHKEP